MQKATTTHIAFQYPIVMLIKATLSDLYKRMIHNEMHIILSSAANEVIVSFHQLLRYKIPESEVVWDPFYALFRFYSLTLLDALPKGFRQ